MNKRYSLLTVLIVCTLLLGGCGEKHSVAPFVQAAEINRDESLYDVTDSESEEQKAAKECIRYMGGGDGKMADYYKAAEVIMPYKDSKDPDVLYCLGVIHEWYMGAEYDYALAKELLEKAELGGNHYASLYLGLMYETGNKDIDKDYEIARDYYRKAILNGVVEGYYGLGRLYAYGHGMKEDDAKAYEHFQKVINEGTDPFYINLSLFNIGYMYYRGTRRDIPIDENNPDGNNKKDEPDPEYDHAMEWFEKAMDSGSTDAAEYIGYMYLNGLGCEKDIDKGLEYYEKAANAGDPSAMEDLGWMYVKGDNLDSNAEKALEWLGKAATFNDPIALHRLGQMYDGGLRVDKDEQKAKEYYDKAYAAGYED